jgi:hypothetical protein
MQMGADLDGSIADVDDLQLDPFGIRAVGVEFDGARGGADRTWP